MPWRSAQKSLNAVRGCFGAAGGDVGKRKKCATMAHEARLWRQGKKKATRRRRRGKRVSRR